MIWVLLVLCVLIAWALWLVLSFSAWVPAAFTVLMGLVAGGIVVWRRLSERRAAGALERAIAQQGAQQAMNARPERRAEIQELQKQVLSGIGALKKSKLGGKKGGASALYRLPWYVIIGPPGAGKTTALKHSGLVFPYADPSGGGVRGVGGTRNCDWWFTNEAILLDTAGRYATEHEDHDEWISFLQMLKKYRSRRPINGILVAISVAELIDASEQQIEMTGKKLRARIDEVMSQLQMVVPVYLLFTKCDLIAGFTEIFGDLRKSDRAQPWGVTFRLAADKSQPGQLFATEFDLLAKQIHARALKRLSQERQREAREKIYQFPLEFSATRKNLADFVQTVFQPNPFQGTPLFRGFYFTSGTQEGRPLDRALSRMAHVMGIRPPEAAQQRAVESKSYFLYDVFASIVFPDGDVATRSAREVRRQMLMRVAVSGAALALALVCVIPGAVSFFNNRALLEDTEARAEAASAVVWNDGRPASEKLAKLGPLLERLEELDEHEREGVPFGMGWFMYSGDEVRGPATAVYVAALERALAQPAKKRLEERLAKVTGSDYLRERQALKVYLLLSDAEHLEGELEWEAGKLTALWAELLRSTSDRSEAELKKLLRPHVSYYLRLLTSPKRKVSPLPPDAALVERVRKTLQAVPVHKRYYDLFVLSVGEQKIDEAGDESRANRRYPSLTLKDLFADRPEVLQALTSERFLKEKAWKEVEGPYTEKGYRAVIENISSGPSFLGQEAWVVPLTPDERPERVLTHVERVATDYENNYILQWSDWFADLTVQLPASVKQAIELYGQLATPEWPLLRAIRAVEDGTQFKRDPGPVNTGEAEKLLLEGVQRRVDQKTGGQLVQVKVPFEKLKQRAQRIQSTFQKLVEFGVPATQARGPSQTDTALARYMQLIDGLKSEMQRVEDQTPNADARAVAERLQAAYAQTEALLQPMDDKAKVLLYPLLTNPLRVGTVARMLPQTLSRSKRTPGR